METTFLDIKTSFCQIVVLIMFVNIQDIQAQYVLETNQDSIEQADSSLTKWLNEVIITASVPLFTRENDRIIVNVATTSLSSTGTALDVIKRLPGVSVNDHAIAVWGRGTPVIYVNNRKVYDQQELQLLQSSDIASIELIISPNAKYDADGRSVLLIKIKQNKENGWAFQASERLMQGKHLGNKENIRISYTHDKYSFFTTYNHLLARQDRNPMATYTVYSDTLWKQFLDVPQTYRDAENQIIVGVDYSVNSKHSAGIQYQGTFDDNRFNATGTETVWANEVLFDNIATTLNSKDKSRKHLINGFYIGNYSKNFGLQVDMDYMNRSNRMNQTVDELSSAEKRQIILFSHSNFTLLAGKLTMTYRIGEKNSVEWGGEYNQIKGSGYLLNPDKLVANNIYTNEEQKSSLFANYNHRWGNFLLQAGIRYETVHAKVTEDTTEQVRTDRNYQDFYPNLSLSHSIGSTQTGLAFSMKTRRPVFSQINNNNYYINRFLSQKGNPYLRNEIIYQMDYYLKNKLIDFSLAYVYKKYPIGFYMDSVSGASPLTIMTFVNYPKYQELNISLTKNLKYKIIQTQLSAGLRQPFFAVDYLGKKLSRNQTAIYFQWFNDIMLFKEYLLSVNFIYQGKNNNYTEINSGYKCLDISVRKYFFNKQILINLQANDIFKWMNDKTLVEVNHIRYFQQAEYETRYLIFTLSYYFKNFKKKYRGMNAANEDIRRL
jgi:hypothetical protein